MNKISFNPDTQDMLKGIASSGAVGAGVGALGMGAANLLSPADDPNHPEVKKRGLLKSMLLGGALGGVTGAGGRALWNYMDPSMAVDSSSGVDKLLTEPKQTPPPTNNPSLLSLNASYPITTGLTAGVGAATAIGKAKKEGLMSADPESFKGKGFMSRLTHLGPDEKALTTLRLLKNMSRNGPTVGLTTALGVGGAGKLMQEPLYNQTQYDAVNQDPNTLKSFLSKYK
jgi:hypothetical protein